MATNGILQGCPLSVVLLNALVAVWSNAVDMEVAGARAESYADDTQALVATRSGITHVAAVTDEFARLSGQTLHLAKSFALQVLLPLFFLDSFCWGRLRLFIPDFLLTPDTR